MNEEREEAPTTPLTRAITRDARSPLGRALGDSKGALGLIFALSCGSNVLMLTSPLFMMQVYDRVLGSKSVPTLIALCMIAAAAYTAQWILDALRQRLSSLVGERAERQAAPAVQRAVLQASLSKAEPGTESLQPFRDLEQVGQFASSPTPLALADLPWVPVYLAMAFVLHPVLGWATVAGALVLAAITLATEVASRGPTRTAQLAASARNQIAEQNRSNAEVMRAMGMATRAWARWNAAHSVMADNRRKASDKGALLSGLAKTARQALQSAVLAIGAYLAVKGEMSGGAIIAASVLSGRALAPIDQVIAGWKQLVLARSAHARLTRLLLAHPKGKDLLELPAPTKSLTVRSLTVATPDAGVPGEAPKRKVAVRDATFTLRAGDAIGVVGPSASGKSSLARALVGIWEPVGGKVCLDGADISQYDPETLGRSIGFMPQDVQIFDGTIAENIARLEPNPDPAKVIAAARAASFHEHALSFEGGYQAKVGPSGSHLSAGQRQRLGLARALYGDPFLVVLDEPNANLDADGEDAVAKAIGKVRERGGIAVVIAHRPSALQFANLILALDKGVVTALGPKEEIFQRLKPKAA